MDKEDAHSQLSSPTGRAGAASGSPWQQTTKAATPDFTLKLSSLSQAFKDELHLSLGCHLTSH